LDGFGEMEYKKAQNFRYILVAKALCVTLGVVTPSSPHSQSLKNGDVALSH